MWALGLSIRRFYLITLLEITYGIGGQHFGQIFIKVYPHAERYASANQTFLLLRNFFKIFKMSLLLLSAGYSHAAKQAAAPRFATYRWAFRTPRSNRSIYSGLPNILL
jgi:hypothetical protein